MQNEQKEIWKDITIYNEIFKGKYQVSNWGRVKSLNYRRTKKSEIISKTKNRYGYEKVNLCSKERKQYTIEVHRLVAWEFCGGYQEGYECHHLNAIKDDNRAENLVWLNKEEHKLITEYESRSKTKKRVRCIELNLEFDSITEATEYFQCGVGNIGHCLIGDSKTACGYHWEYID